MALPAASAGCAPESAAIGHDRNLCERSAMDGAERTSYVALTNSP
jgi:hypothetical protein